jgi:hypothetical protein
LPIFSIFTPLIKLLFTSALSFIQFSFYFLKELVNVIGIAPGDFGNIGGVTTNIG